VSGAKERRPALDALLSAARRRDVAVVVVTKLDRLARSLHQLVAFGREFEALGVDLVVTDQAVDTTCTAPDSLDSRERSDRALPGDT
jgi:DNA invertase Pin-like site-specific DNA recombinase